MVVEVEEEEEEEEVVVVVVEVAHAGLVVVGVVEGV